MTALAIAAAILAVAWAVLVVVAQVLNPDQSPLSMGMSGLARGRVPWVMKSSFLARGVSALMLLSALPSQLHVAGSVVAGFALFWVWGVGSAVLALADTDMPGEAPTRAGAAHALIAMVAYVAGAAGAIVLSLDIARHTDMSGVATWALPISIIAAVALVVQFVAFGAAAREARASAPGAGPAPPAAGPAPPAPADLRRRPLRRRPPACRRSSALPPALRRPAGPAPRSPAGPPAQARASCTASPATPASASASSSGCSWPGRCWSRSACSRPSATRFLSAHGCAGDVWCVLGH